MHLLLDNVYCLNVETTDAFYLIKNLYDKFSDIYFFFLSVIFKANFELNMQNWHRDWYTFF